LGEVDVNGRIILRWFLNKSVVKMLTGINWLRIGSSVTASCGKGNELCETSGSYGGEYEDVFWDVEPCGLVVY
jgi:hypothetical protein